MPNILDPKFRYIPSSQTDLKKTFRKERERLRQQQERANAVQLEQQAKVRTIKGAK